METIVSSDMEGSMDRGSKEAREELLRTSLQLMAAHPLVGIGPGNFASVSGTWHAAHNTYTELGAEAGVPALFLFVVLLLRARINLKRVSRSKVFTHNVEIQIFTGAMWASFAAYLVGAAFADTQYELFPYFLVAYTTVLYHLACVLPNQVAFIAASSATPSPAFFFVTLAEVIDLKAARGKGRIPGGWCRGVMLADERRVWVGFTRIRKTVVMENLVWMKHGLHETEAPTHVALYDIVDKKCLKEIELEHAGINILFGILPLSEGWKSDLGPSR